MSPTRPVRRCPRPTSSPVCAEPRLAALPFRPDRSRARAQPGDEDAGSVRNGPYVASPAGDGPVCARGTDWARDSDAAATRSTAAITSTTNASFA